LVDLPGVNSQEKTKDELIEAFRIGVQEMLVKEKRAGLAVRESEPCVSFSNVKPTLKNGSSMFSVLINNGSINFYRVP